VRPLAHFGAISDVCDGGVVLRTDHHDAGERSGGTQHCDLKAHHASEDDGGVGDDDSDDDPIDL
jgi:hypothetical protein